MAVETIVFNAKNTAADTVEKFADAPTNNAIEILGFTASNNSDASVTYKAYIYSSESLVDAIIPQKIVVPDRFDLGPSIVGMVIPKGGSLRMETSTAEALLFNVVGQEIA